MLSQDELYEFTGPVNESVQLSRTAVRRIFEENITYSPMEMDYKVRITSTNSQEIPPTTIFLRLSSSSSGNSLTQHTNALICRLSWICYLR